MARNLKALGLALVVAFAMSAVAASAASALTHHFDTSKAGTKLKAKAVNTQEFFLTTSDATKFVKCTETSATGTLPATTNTSVTIAPSYNGCKANITGSEVTAKVEFNGCHYLFTGDTTETVTTGEHATAHIECPVEKSVEVKVTAANLKCLTIHAQTVHGVKYSNDPLNAKAVNVKATVHGIKSTTTGGCVIGGVVEHNDGYYQGEVTVEGTEGEDLSVVST